MSSILHSFSIVSHNQFQLCQDLIESIKLNVENFEIILTINTIENIDKKWLSSIKNLNLILNKKPKGFGENHNNAANHCSGINFIITNPDIKIIAWDNTFVFNINKLYSPLIFNNNLKMEDHLRNIPTIFNILKRQIFKKKFVKNPKWFAGMFLIINKNKFIELGGFDKRFFMYLEDADLCLRAKKLGCDLSLLHDFKVIHIARRSSNKSLYYLLIHINSFLKFYMKYPKYFFLDI